MRTEEAHAAMLAAQVAFAAAHRRMLDLAERGRRIHAAFQGHVRTGKVRAARRAYRRSREVGRRMDVVHAEMEDLGGVVLRLHAELAGQAPLN